MLFSRRKVLSALLGLAAFHPLRLLAAPSAAPDAGAALLGLCLDCVTARTSASFLGRLYLQDHPWEASRRRLTETLLAGLGAMSRAGGATDRSPFPTTEQLRALHISDFERGHTVELDGWVLSRTEARLCALAALS